MAVMHCYICTSLRPALIGRARSGKQALKPLSDNVGSRSLTVPRSPFWRQGPRCFRQQQRRWKTDASATRYPPNFEGATKERVRPSRTRSDKSLRFIFLAIGAVSVLFSAAFVSTTRNNEAFKVWLWGQYVKDWPKRPNSISQGFWPYRVVSVRRVTDTSFVLTVEPHFEGFLGALLIFHMKHTYMNSQGYWNNGMWSVDIKEPHVQIARHFTPLPPRDGDDPWEGKLRFYIRSFKGGEMSRYLDSLKTGDSVEVRGPHWGFDVKERMGQGERVVFLAGGTGISPGMQMAREAMERDRLARATLLWAVRTSEEVAGLDPWPHREQEPAAGTGWLDWTRGTYRRLTLEGHHPKDVAGPSNPVTEQLNQMQQRYGERLVIRTAIDETAACFTTSGIRASLLLPKSPSSPRPPSPSCLLHSPRMQVVTSEKNDWMKACSCRGGPVSKNIFMISGPDGFIKHFAGAKTWQDGEEKQGRVGGIIGQVLAQTKLADEWLVLKL